MEQQDIERILRDVATSQGIAITIVRVEPLTGGWIVTITDRADRIVSTSVADGPPATVRAALLQWLDTTHP
jgi:hypothetical protein